MAINFKQRYASKWRLSMLRELFVYDYLNWLLVSHGYLLKYTGLGAGSAEYISRYYRDVGEAFDFAIYTFSGKLVGFLDVTGYASSRRARVDAKRCVGLWKIEKAKRIKDELGIPLRRIWVAHFTDDSHILVFLNIERLLQLINNGRAEKRRLYEDEKISYCLELRYWVPPRRFIDVLLQYTG